MVPEGDHFKLTFEIALIVVGFFIITGNVFVLATMYRYPRVRTVSNMFIISLAISDLVVGIWTAPVTLVSLKKGRWVLGQMLCSTSAFLDNIAITASIWTLGVSSVDRYVAISRPLRYKVLIPYQTAYYMIGFAWVFCAALCLPPVLGWDGYGYSHASYNCGIMVDGPSYFIFFLILGIFLPLIISIYCYASICYVAIKHTIVDKTKNHSVTTQKMAVRKTSLRISGTIFAIIGAFLVCTLPIFIIGFLQVCNIRIELGNTSDMIVHVMLFSNSAINPLVYSFGAVQFRTAFVDLVLCRSRNHSALRENVIYRAAINKKKRELERNTASVGSHNVSMGTKLERKSEGKNSDIVAKTDVDISIRVTSMNE